MNVIKKIIIVTFILTLLTSNTVIALHNFYINNERVLFQTSKPFRIEFRGSQCKFAYSVDELINMFNNGDTSGTKHLVVWSDKFFISDTDGNPYTVPDYMPQVGNKDTLNCVVVHITTKIYTPKTITITLGLDSDDASAILIDGTPVLTWLGGHPPAWGVKYSKTITLQPGYHQIDGYAQDKYGNFVLALYIKKNGRWRILDSKDFTFIVDGKLNDYAYENSDNPIVFQYKKALSNYDAPTSTHSINFIAHFSKVYNGEIVFLNTFRASEGVELPKLDYYIGHLMTLVMIPKYSCYDFGLSGDDAVDFRIDGNVILSYYGAHATSSTPQRTTTYCLTPGLHLFEIYYYERTGGSDARLFIKKNGVWKIVSTNDFTMYKPLFFNQPLAYFKYSTPLRIGSLLNTVNNKFKPLPIEVK